MALQFDQVSYRYPGSIQGVTDISLKIGDGELVALIGASGSGKSTLLRLLCGFAAPDRGQVRIDGEDVSPAPPERRKLGVVFQDYALFPHMRLWENVAYPLKVRGMARDARQTRACEMLARVGMAGREQDRPDLLSGGQRQRVALARALVFGPRGLLLDEPLSALDAGLRAEMRDEIQRVQRQAGIATLLVTHDQEEALSIADRVAVMRDGRIVQIATPHEVYDRPAEAWVAAFVGQSNLWPGTVAASGRVETALGPFTCDTGPRPKGERVTLLVRPERVIPGAGPINGLTGTATADRFLGPVRRLDLSVPGGTVKVETHLPGLVRDITIPPDAIRLLPAEASLSTAV
ncbi:ABC transporter ATP-binding protein [Cereibacter changlensis JA139]|uniref:ABC transporter ATP-binding protein n=2 Tax=Cereibacter changlensis TaxID=402884 RepID=A0A2T4JPM4_9RHOB|nr:ABC transporter ATP-binding protein [Cereibacter changlensis]PTE19851.1 ABC transporter ATP-binding protein [Cereibacter changlensis JA139]PZX49988.1 putative spermidine/putrescine transport system ATP-binding protein [Cereibacter changlensis]